MMEREQPLLCQRVQELHCKQGVARGLALHKAGERPHMIGRRMKRVRDELQQIVFGQRGQGDGTDNGAALPERGESFRQGMRAHLFVAVGAYQQQMTHIARRQQVNQEIEGCRIEPLQVVEKQRQRMLRPGKNADEAPHDKVETPLRILRRQFHHGRLLAKDELQFRHQIQQQRRVRVQRFGQRLAPSAQFGFRLAEKRPNKALKREREGRIGNVGLVLVELA